MCEENNVSPKEDEESINLYLFKLCTFAHKEPNAYFSMAQNELDLDQEQKDKLSIILRIFLIYYSDNLREYIQNSNISLLLSFYYYLIEHIKLRGKSTVGVQLPGLPITSVSAGDTLKEQINTGMRLLKEELSRITHNDIYELNSVFVNALSINYEACCKRISEYESTAQKINDELKEREQKWVLSSFSGNFDKIAKSENFAKSGWLIASLTCGTCALAWLACNVYTLIMRNSEIQISEYIVRISLTFILFIIAFWFSKLYSIARNQLITYRHIAALINIYDIIKDTTQDNTEKNIVMTEMAHTIFSPPKLPNVKTIDRNDMPQVIELIKLFINKE